MGHTQQTLARLPEAMAECYFHFQRLPHCKISSLSLMARANRLRGARPEYRINAEELERIQRPTMLYWGTNDPFGSVETGRRIAKILPSSRFHIAQGAGHLPWLDDPAGCARLTLDFLTGVTR
jgi:pimeloyl-ACP methyl ester carboxylesterase